MMMNKINYTQRLIVHGLAKGESKKHHGFPANRQASCRKVHQTAAAKQINIDKDVFVLYICTYSKIYKYGHKTDIKTK